MKATVIVVVHAGAERLDDSLASLERYRSRPEVEVVLVDNGSADSCSEVARRRYPWARVVRSETNLGFAGGVHLGAEAAEGEVLVLLNDDAAAEEGWLEAHLELLAKHPEAAVSAGRLVSWDGTRHDFLRPAVTFDAHAFQVGYGRPVVEVEGPATGEPVALACGGNLAIRRTDWVASGGFDRELFAYYEDLDLGWRLWASGRQVLASPNALARHRGGATSGLLGDFRRGVLFERNALRTFFACADEEHRGALGPAVLATFLHRLVAFARAEPELGGAIADPFDGGNEGLGLVDRWRRRLRERGLAATLRHLLARVLLGPGIGRPSLDPGHLVMQLRAADGFFAGLGVTEERRAELGRRRAVPDRALLERFPRLVVPTYFGDEEWFESDGFAALLPDGWPLERRRLEELIEARVGG